MNYNPYYNSFYPMQQMQQPKYQPIEQPIQQPVQQYNSPVQELSRTNFLLGKSVDSIDVVKALDIPLDGSTSYFPLTDASAIVTKRLQTDGTSKIIIYKPVEEDTKDKTRYITEEELNNKINNIDLTEIEDLKEDIREIRKEIKDFKAKLKNKGD